MGAQDRKFRTTDGEYTLRVTYLAAKRLRDECGIDLLQCLRDPSNFTDILQRLADSPELIVSACVVVLDIPEDKADAFVCGFTGNEFEAAEQALLQAMADFFPTAPRTLILKVIRKAAETGRQLVDAASEKAHQAVDDLDFRSVALQSQTRGSGPSGS